MADETADKGEQPKRQQSEGKKQWSEDELRDCFYVFDSDGNGFIDMDELFMACKMLGCNDQQAEKQAEKIKQACDENKDNKISWDEFKKNFSTVM